MYRRTIIFFGMVGVFLSLVMGLYSVVTWEIVAVLVAVFLGIPSLILTYEKVKPAESMAQRKAERKNEKERIKIPTPSPTRRKKQRVLLAENADITNLNIDDSFLDKIYEKARHKAVDMYHDAKLSTFDIQVYPFAEGGRRINIYLDFYSKWADKICKMVCHGMAQQVTHNRPDKSPISDHDREVLTSLPWKENPYWKQILKRVYGRIGPFAPDDMTAFYIDKSGLRPYWDLSFKDNFTGNDYYFKWDGKGLDENSVKQL